MELIANTTHKLQFGKRINFSKVLFLLLVPAFFSCSPMKQYRKHNYFNGGKFYNDTINISAQLFGDINFSKPKRKTFRKFKKVRGLMYRDLLFTGTSYIEPLYDLLFFYNEKQEGQYPDTAKTTTRYIFQDSTDMSVLFEKSLKGKTISVYLRPLKGTSSILEDGKQIIDNVKFDISVKDKLTYSEIFNSYMGESINLHIMHKLNTAPIPYSKQSEWTKFQYLATILANDTSYPTYSEIIENFEANRKKHLTPILSEILQRNPEVEKTLEETINNIKLISVKEKVVMLNEMHWTPKHRILATQLLQPLKENGYNYLAVEAVNQDFVADLNKRTFPTKNTGYYTREPFFGMFLRKAIDMGFKIVAYDEFGSENREKTQAENLNKIFKEDPTAKVFVYAGIDHILENNPNNIKMAQYFKDITGIDPITIDQVELVGNEENEVLFLPSRLVPKNKNINSNVDYFLINNIETSFNKVFDNSELSSFKIDISNLKNIQKQESYLSVYVQGEFQKYKLNTVPIFNKILKAGTQEASTKLPFGNYEMRIWDINNNMIFSSQIEVFK